MKNITRCILGTLLYTFALFCQASLIFINEIHYDNSGGDKNEFIEVTGSAGLSLAGWSLELYNGTDGSLYKTESFSNVILADQSNGYGFTSIAMKGIQNGSPDGIALIDNHNTLIQFLSYEGQFTATNGTAKNIISQDIGIKETSSTPANWSLQLTGAGTNYKDFSWLAAEHTSKKVNFGQHFQGSSSKPVAQISEPTTAILLMLSTLLIFLTKQKKHIRLKTTQQHYQQLTRSYLFR